MARSLTFYQIYYADSQLEELYPFAKPFRNETLTPYFENSVIAQLVPQCDTDLISVCSWKLLAKRIDCSRQLLNRPLEYERIVNTEYDIAVLTPRSSSHKALHMAAHWHKEAWVNAINDLRNFIKIPREVTTPIYENHFIATRSIYHAYVADCLSPAMEYTRDRSVYYEDSGYVRRKTPEEAARYMELTGRKDWPILPFILERLFSIWIEGQKFKIVNI